MLFVPHIYAICTIHLWYLYHTFVIFVPYIYAICTIHLWYLYRTFMIFVPYIYDICTLHLWYLYLTFMIFVPYIYDICTAHLWYLHLTFMIFVPHIYAICTVHFLDYIKSCSDKCTPFIICYLIQFILKIVQHVSNYVRLSSGTQLFITSAIAGVITTNSTQLTTFYLPNLYILMSTVRL
jgi:hypothetical protein